MTDTTPTTPRRVSIEDLPTLVGRNLGTSGPIEVPQHRIDAFAEATEDRQWIHVDADRARGGPFGGTIAHGYLTLSLSTALFWQLLEVPDAAQVINYGLNKVRFPAPVPSGSSVRMSLVIESVDEVPNGYQVAYRGTAVVDGQDKPACVAQGLFRYYRS